jgi:hypothetical protein
MKRDFCAACALKHVMQARALMLETRKGYPTHTWYALGHLAEAEDECVERMPDTASAIRAERLKIEKDVKYMPDWGSLAIIIATDGMLPGSEMGDK